MKIISNNISERIHVLYKVVLGAGTGHQREGAEEFRENWQRSALHMVRSTVAERERCLFYMCVHV